MKKHKPAGRSPILMRIANLFESFNLEEKESYYQKLFGILKDVVHFSNASIFFFNYDNNKLELISTYGNAVDLIHTVEFEFGKGLSAWLAKEQRSVILNNMKQNSNSHAMHSIRSFMSIPLILDNKLFGIINFGHVKTNAFSKSALPYLKVSAPFIAAMLSQNHYIETLQKKNEEILEINEKLKTTQNELINLQKKEAVSATVCSLNHEINNPLMIISGNIQLLSALEDNPVKLTKLTSVEEQIERISFIMSKLREIESPLFEKYIQDGDYDKILKIDKDEV